jgi:hypothetical protein
VRLKVRARVEVVRDDAAHRGGATFGRGRGGVAHPERGHRRGGDGEGGGAGRELRQRKLEALAEQARPEAGAGRRTPGAHGSALGLDLFADAQPEGALVRRDEYLPARVARGGDDGVEVFARGGAKRAGRQVRADRGVLRVAERAVEELAEQFLALLAVHLSKPLAVHRANGSVSGRLLKLSVRAGAGLKG